MTARRAGEERLARAIVAQALADAGIGTESGNRLTVSRPDREAALRFLTAHNGSWKAAREYWACWAEVDPEKLRTRTMEILGIEPPPVEAPKAMSNEPLRLFVPVPKPEKPPRIIPKVQAPPKKPSRRKQVFDLLTRPEGVAIDEIAARFGWKRATAYTYIRFEVRSFGVQGVLCRDGRYRAYKRADDGRLIVEAA